MQVLPLVSLLVLSGQVVLVHVVPVRFALDRSVRSKAELTMLVLLRSIPAAVLLTNNMEVSVPLLKFAFDRSPSLTLMLDKVRPAKFVPLKLLNAKPILPVNVVVVKSTFRKSPTKPDSD